MKSAMKQRLLGNPRRTLLVIALFALGIRLMAGAFFYNEFDLKSFNIPWAIGMQDGFFSCYRTMDFLNYPPLFPALLRLVSPVIRWAQQEGIWQITMLFIKLIPILFDVGTLLVLYFAVEQRSKAKALLVAALWSVNPVTFVNCALWGQADTILLFFMALTFLLFYRKRPVFATVVFALGCLAKLQMLYLAPVVLCELFFRYRPKTSFGALGAGLLTGIGGWLPFMIGSGELLLPFRIYFGGFGQYSTVNMYAYNVYGLPFLGSMSEKSPIINGFFLTYQQLSMLFLLLLLTFVVGMGWYIGKRRLEVPAFLTAMLYLNGIFMLTTKQHERYQIPVLILAALCWLLLEDKRFRLPFAAMLVIPFVNEACGLFNMHYGAWFQFSVSLYSLYIGSVLNVLVFGYMIWLYIRVVREAASRPALAYVMQDRAPAKVK